MKTIICAFVISLLLTGCGGPESDFEKAKTEKSIDAFVNFMKTYPESELIADAKNEIGALLGRINIRTVDKETKEPFFAILFLTGGDKSAKLDSLIMNDFEIGFDTLDIGSISIKNLTAGYYSLYVTPDNFGNLVKVQDSIAINGPDVIDVGTFEVSRK